MNQTNTTQQTKAVSIRQASYAYTSETVLHGINLDIEQGDFVAFIGPNGGGKSTLLKLLMGLAEPREGTVQIFGQQPARMRHAIGYVPQFATLRTDFPACVLEMVLMGQAVSSPTGGGWSRGKAARERAMALLETLGIAGAAKASVRALSGGQRQRALVARALMGRQPDSVEPFLLLLDEPTASIDIEGKHCFYDVLDTLRGQCTIVVVSHDLMLASPYFSAIALINNSLTLLPEKRLTLASLEEAFGMHNPSCPIGVLQHAVDRLQAEAPHA